MSNKDYGIKVSRNGVDVKDAKDDELIMTSKYSSMLGGYIGKFYVDSGTPASDTETFYYFPHGFGKRLRMAIGYAFTILGVDTNYYGKKGDIKPFELPTTTVYEVSAGVYRFSSITVVGFDDKNVKIRVFTQGGYAVNAKSTVYLYGLLNEITDKEA